MQFNLREGDKLDCDLQASDNRIGFSCYRCRKEMTNWITEGAGPQGDMAFFVLKPVWINSMRRASQMKNSIITIATILLLLVVIPINVYAIHESPVPVNTPKNNSTDVYSMGNFTSYGSPQTELTVEGSATNANLVCGVMRQLGQAPVNTDLSELEDLCKESTDKANEIYEEQNQKAILTEECMALPDMTDVEILTCFSNRGVD